MTAPERIVVKDNAIARQRLRTRIDTLRQTANLSGRAAQICFPVRKVAFSPVAEDKRHNHGVGRHRWKSDRYRPGYRNHARACRAEMAAMAVIVISETLAFGRLLAQFRAHFETIDRAGRVRQICVGREFAPFIW